MKFFDICDFMLTTSIFQLITSMINVLGPYTQTEIASIKSKISVDCIRE